MSIAKRLAALEGRQTTNALARLRRAVADAKAEFARAAPSPEAAEAALARLEAARPPDTPETREIEAAVRATMDERATEAELRAALAGLFPAGTPAHAMFDAMAELIERGPAEWPTGREEAGRA